MSSSLKFSNFDSAIVLIDPETMEDTAAIQSIMIGLLDANVIVRCETKLQEAKNLKENLTIATTLPIYKDSRLKNPKVRTQFLGQVYNFLGGLGNALTYAGKLKWEL